MTARSERSAYEDLVRAEREIGLRGGLHRFIRMAWHIVEPSDPFIDNWSVGAIAEHLEAVYRGQIRRLIINVPPGCMKSLEVCVFWPVWEWIQTRGASRWLFTSFDGELTLRDSSRALQILQSEWFQARWGERVKLRGRDPATGMFETMAGGFRFATSVGGKATGRHPDYQVIDDPTKPKEATKTNLEATIKYAKETLATRWRNIETGRRVLIMQRLHENDLAGHYLEEGGYTHLCFPMRYEASNPCVTVLGKVDLREEEGALLWEARFPPTALAELEKDLGPAATAAQLQQRPAPAGGMIFQDGWFGYWIAKDRFDAGYNIDHLPVGRWRVLPERFDLELFSLDAAFKETKKSDPIALHLWSRKGAENYLRDRWGQRADFVETLKIFKNAVSLYPLVLTKLVEDKANGPAIISMLKSEVPGMIEVDPQGGKEARANAIAPYYAAGNVFVPDPAQNPKRFEWVKPLITQHTSFPFAKHDDDVDAASQALTYMHNSAALWLAAMRALAKRNGGGS